MLLRTLTAAAGELLITPAAQEATYPIKGLDGSRSGERTNDPNHAMLHAARAVSCKNTAALAAFLASLPGPVTSSVRITRADSTR
jgi:cytochrome c553